MKVLHISPTFEQPHCGIGAYTRHLCAGIKSVAPDTKQIILQGFTSFHQQLLNASPDVVHIQLEYGFCSPERLTLIDEYCFNKSVPLFITFHSLSTCPHNVATRHAVRLAHTPLSKLYGEFQVIPSGVPVVTPCSEEHLIAKIGTETFLSDPYLFFGQAHPHKQLHELLLKMGEDKTSNLICVVSQPVQGSTDYYDKCKALATQLFNVKWIEPFLDDAEVLKLSEYVYAALFPYEEYGAIGVSAAVKLLLNNPTLRIITTVASHFSDIEDGIVIKTSSLNTMLRVRHDHNQYRRDYFVEKRNFNEVAKTHLKLYERYIIP